jgi:hypothetical protein
MSVNKPPKNYEDMYLKISKLVLKGDHSLISQPLQSLLIQKIATPLQKDLQFNAAHITGKRSLPSILDLLRKNEIKICDGKLKVSSKKFLKYFIMSTVILLFSTLYFLIMPKVKSISRFNLVYGLSSEMIYRQSREIHCDKFFNKVNPKLYNSESVALIQLFNFNFRNKSKENYKVVLYIPLFILRAQGISKLQLIKNLSKRFQLWRSIYKKLPCAVMLGPELMLDSSSLIDLREIKSMSTTVSQWGVQPYFFHKLDNIPKNFFWYSNNSVPLVITEFGTSDLELSYLRLVKANHHFVWTNRFGKLINEFVDVNYTVLESILFYLPSEQNFKKLYDILIFDITPTKFYELTSYYSSSNCTKFISDILEAVNILSSRENPISLALKPKRKYSKSHLNEYIDIIETLSYQERVKLIDPDSDIFELIKSAKFVVAIPFSTPALIAKRLGVKTCYYNPDSRYRFKKTVDGVRVISTIEEFVDFYNT